MSHSPSCPEHCPHESAGVGSAPIWAPLWFLGTCIAIVIAVKVAEDIWPYALMAAAAIGAWKVTPPIARAISRRRDRRLALRAVPIPDPAIVAAPARTRVENVTVLPLDMRKTPGLNWAGRGRAGKAV